jgi:hypothetical protein
VVAKLAGDGSASHRCKVAHWYHTDDNSSPCLLTSIISSLFLQVFLEGSGGKSYSKEARLIGCDPAYDLAVLKVWNFIICGSSSGDVKLVRSCGL